MSPFRGSAAFTESWQNIDFDGKRIGKTKLIERGLQGS